MFINCLIFINISIEHIVDYFGYFCIDLIIKHSVNMKTKKEFKYHLKKYVRDDLENLDNKLSLLLYKDVNGGFDSMPSLSFLFAFVQVYSHLICRTKFKFWFKKIYDKD